MAFPLRIVAIVKRTDGTPGKDNDFSLIRGEFDSQPAGNPRLGQRKSFRTPGVQRGIRTSLARGES